MLASKSSASTRIVPHPRTLRKAREQIHWMVADEVSPPKIRQYLSQWACWWQKASGLWTREELIRWYLDACWETRLATIGHEILNCLRPAAQSVARCDGRSGSCA